MMLRNDSYSFIIRCLFPQHIRLSIHDSNNIEKVGVHMVGRSIITPWHGVPVRHLDGMWSIMRRKHVHAKEEYKLVTVDKLSEIPPLMLAGVIVPVKRDEDRTGNWQYYQQL